MRSSAEFPGGITNGARWYPLWGGMQDWHYIATGTMDVTIEVNDEKFPNARELSRLWREHRGGIFAAATVATRGALRGFVRDGATGEPIANAALAVEGVEFPFAPNARGFFARPVSSGPGAEGDEESDGALAPFAVTVAATRGYVAAAQTATVDPVDGADLVFEMVRVQAARAGAEGAARSRNAEGVRVGAGGGPRSGERRRRAVRGNKSRPAADRTGDRGLAGPFPSRGGVGRRRVRHPGGRGDDTQAARADGEGEGGLQSRGRVIDV